VPVAVLPGLPAPVGPTGIVVPAVSYSDTSDVEFVRAPRPDMAGTRDAARDVLDHLWKMGDPRVVGPVLGWHVAALWAPAIREVTGGRFPIMNIAAPRGSGKTTLLEVIGTAIHGGVQVLTARATRFALLRDLSASTTIPVVLDEYRRGELADSADASLRDLARRTYDGSSDQRGRADQTVRTYRLRAPLVIAGEARIVDPAVSDRSIMVSLQRDDMVEWRDSRRALTWLLGHPDSCRQAAGFLLRRRLDDPMPSATLGARITAHRARLNSSAAIHGIHLTERAIDALAVVAWALDWLADIGLPYVDLDWADQLQRAADLRRDQGPVDWFLEFLEAVAADPRHPVPIAATGGHRKPGTVADGG
jgi:hypothetical protein